ncbi:unnamed protein product [marine sediment metagenome]|uniref:Uncharacterized protein n=1 Tax=marine sediment metagenome TaxID=412755 RepID=X0X085_9ZZZZ
MSESEVENVMNGLEDGHHVVIWYKPVKDFSIDCGEFSIGDCALACEEVDYVVKNKPLVASVESSYEEDERQEDDYPEGTFTDVDSGREIPYVGSEISAYWSIEVRTDIEGHVSDVEVAGSTFTFNQLSHSASLDGGETSRSQLEELHEKLGEFLQQTA